MSPDAKHATLEARLERVERQNQWLKRWGTLGFLVVALVVLGAQAGGPQDVVEAREFRLVGEGGETLAALARDDEGFIRLGLTKPDGTPGTSLLLFPGEADTEPMMLIGGSGFGFLNMSAQTPQSAELSFARQSTSWHLVYGGAQIDMSANLTAAG